MKDDIQPRLNIVNLMIIFHLYLYLTLNIEKKGNLGGYQCMIIFFGDNVWKKD